MNNAVVYLTIFASILGTTGFAAVINWVRDRKKDSLLVDAQTVGVLKEIIDQLNIELKRVRDQLNAAEREIERIKKLLRDESYD